MSVLDFLGGAAGTGAGILERQIQSQDQLANAQTLAQLNQQLDIQKANTLAELKQSRDKASAQEVQSAADKARTDRIVKLLNSGDADPLAPAPTPDPSQAGLIQQYADQGTLGGSDIRAARTAPPGIIGSAIAPSEDSPPDPNAPPAPPARKVYTADDVGNLTPAQLKTLGIKDDRAQRYDDLAAAAEAGGHLDMAKEFRGQQQVELSRLSQEAASRRQETMQALQLMNEQRKEARDEAWKQNEAAKRERDDRRNDIAQQRVEAMMARLEKSGSNHPARDVLQFLTEQRKALANESTEASQVFQRLIDPMVTRDAKAREDLQASYRDKMADIAKRRKSIDADYAAARGMVGLPAGEAEAPVPAPGPAPSTKSPYPEGTRLSGPGGKTYIVRNGVPVLE